MESTSVLIVGGSLVGLSMAVFLAERGVATVVLERRGGSSPHPRAIGFTPRTLELYRAVGLEERIPQTPASFRLRRTTVESLAGKWLEEAAPWAPEKQKAPHQAPAAPFSPCAGAAIAQDSLEPILRAKAGELGADVRFDNKVLHVEQDAHGVTALVRRADGGEYHIRADYLVAADGHRSPVREALGIGRSGRGHLRTLRSVLFRAPLDQYLESGVAQFNIAQPGWSAFLTTYGDGRWVLMFSDDQERDEAELTKLIRRAIGRDDIEVEVIVTGRWELRASIADRFRDGRVFLAGDAAHTLPPSRGGYGANTGIEDAHNLAWKLASVLSGRAAPALLDTYDAERRPVAWLRHDQIFTRNDYKEFSDAGAAMVAVIDDDAMEFGQLYRSGAVLGAGAGLPAAARPDQWAGQPGTRAPHVPISIGDEQRSTLDLFGHGWVLLFTDARWSAAARLAGDAVGVPLKAMQAGSYFIPARMEDWHAAYGLGADGAALIRPDGYVAWRAPALPADPAAALTAAFGQVAFAVGRA